MTPFVTIEGPDGAGKTSQSKRLAEWMGAEWRCFPDRRTPIGQLIDGHLRNEWSAKPGLTLFPYPQLDALVFQGLQLANRIEVQPAIIASLEAGRPVVCDRYWGSGYAYGSADGLDPGYMLDIHRGLLRPTVSVLLDVPLDVAVARLKTRGAPAERYEGNLEHMHQVAARYRELWGLAPLGTVWVTIDASAEADEVQARLRRSVAEVIRSVTAEARR